MTNKECKYCKSIFLTSDKRKLHCSDKCKQKYRNDKRKVLKALFLIENIEGEIWKDIKGYEGMYQVSNMGRIKGLRRVINRINSPMELPEKLLTPILDKHGYFIIHLSKENKKKKFYIHRLLGEYFIGNPTNQECINHKNGIKTDNSLDNLEWCTIAENNQHAFKIGLNKKGKEHHLYGKKGIQCHNHKQYKKPIEEEKPPIW